MKPIMLDLNAAEIAAIMSDAGQPPYRATQIFTALHSGKEFSEISNIPKTLIAALEEKYSAQPVAIEKEFPASDGSKKYLFRLCDGILIEGVLMSYKYGKTLCVSTQAGCRMGCAFCASGIDGLARNLTPGEILGQIIVVNRAEGGDANGRAVTNVVLMGSGEPLDNFGNTMKFLNLAGEQGGICVGQRNISLSTSGIAPKMRELADSGFSVTLTVSLHAPDDAVRERLMPVNKAYPVKEVIAAAKYYFEKTGRRVVFEYALINGVNDSAEQAARLAALTGGFPSHINLIKLNYVKEKNLRGSEKDVVRAFERELKKRGASVTLRRTLGGEVGGACGQLRRSYKP
ncbi:MAG: 23S rRNA (adenine(2503)-C(2))-methyltransferase RlmN [Clostridiales bacterium]|jgi:23S rRNA (adenine2503-C2)-methyltransferase|nr:23S rRNA (adenine(2503)-C(2))-methyltransferase RlmN [Clostridiales bacterium]